MEKALQSFPAIPADAGCAMSELSTSSPKHKSGILSFNAEIAHHSLQGHLHNRQQSSWWSNSSASHHLQESYQVKSLQCTQGLDPACSHQWHPQQDIDRHHSISAIFPPTPCKIGQPCSFLNGITAQQMGSVCVAAAFPVVTVEHTAHEEDICLNRCLRAL